MELRKEQWGEISGNIAWLYTVYDEGRGFSIEISNLGATLNRFKLKNKEGNLEDITYGWDSVESLLLNEGNSFLGATVGRTASITFYGQFEIDGVTYNLSKNMMGIHHQHVGFSGFNKKFMKPMKEHCANDSCSLIFEFESLDGEEGYPGNLKGTVEYRITLDNNDLLFEYIIKAKTDKATPVNIVNHGYWNLDGVGKTVDGLSLSVDADKYLAIDNLKTVLKSLGGKIGIGKKSKDPMRIEDLGEKKPKLRTPMKFSDIFAKYGDVDDNFILDKSSEKIIRDSRSLTHAVKLESESSGRVLDIYTTEPAIVIYTGNFMDKVQTMGLQCKKHYAVCLETCKPSNSVRMDEFRDWVLLKPGDEYCHHTLLKFSF